MKVSHISAFTIYYFYYYSNTPTNIDLKKAHYHSKTPVFLKSLSHNDKEIFHDITHIARVRKEN